MEFCGADGWHIFGNDYLNGVDILKLQIDWERPIFQENIVLQIAPSDLDDFYVEASDLDKANLFFILLASFQHYLERKERERAAHLSFLMAYYLFNALTPPGSCELSIHYIKQAISLNPIELYTEWLSLIEKEN